MTGPAPTFTLSGEPDSSSFRRALYCILLLIIATGAAEVVLSRVLASPALAAAGIEWGYDAAIYAAALVSFGRGPVSEQRASWVIAAILAAAAIHGGIDLWKDPFGREDDSASLPIDSAATMLVAVANVALLIRFRHSVNVVIKAAFVAALAGLGTDAVSTLADLLIAALAMPWLTLASGLIIVLLNLLAALAIVRDSIAGKASMV